jgi:AMP phosphorylase
MRLLIKKLDLEAGRPIAFIHEKNAAKIGAHIGDRVLISQNGKKTTAAADISKGIVNEHEVAFSKEVLEYMPINYSKPAEISLAVNSESARFIAKKLSGKTLSKDEIKAIIRDIVNNSLAESEIAYFVSAVYEKGMSFNETIHLTEAIVETGQKIDWHTREVADKHSIGGIAGNRTTPIVVSICAAAGITMPKTSSRAITSASGTADVIETLAKVDFSAQELKNIVKKTGACLAWGGSLGLAPADDKLIRVERLLNLDPEAQLLASIMSKKIAAGSKYILIDIPYGPQAKVSKEEAKKLKQKFLKIAKAFKLKMKVILTLGEQPIGNGIGPVLEMIDVLKVLKQENQPRDLENKSIFMAAIILEMMHKAKPGKGEFVARSILETGAALEKFNQIISAQGRTREDLSLGRFKEVIKSSRTGKIANIDNKHINTLARILGCPEDKKAGIYIYHHKGDFVEKSQPLLVLYAENKRKLEEGLAYLKSTVTVTVI